jgi:hypothetical protein
MISTRSFLLGVGLSLLPPIPIQAQTAEVSFIRVGPARVAPGERVEFTLRVKNTGTSAWSPISSAACHELALGASTCLPYPNDSGKYGIQLLAFKMDDPNPYSDASYRWGIIPLPRVIGPGETVDISDYFMAPSQPGRYTLAGYPLILWWYSFSSRILNTPQDVYNLTPRFDFQVDGAGSKPIVLIVPGFGASTLTTHGLGGIDAWLSCGTILEMENGSDWGQYYLSMLQFDEAGRAAIPLSPTRLLAEGEPVGSEPQPKLNSLLACPTDDLKAMVKSAKSWWSRDGAATSIGFGSRSQLQAGILEATVAFQQFTPLVQTLKNAGYTAETFPYDFRLGLRELALQLKSRIETYSNQGRSVAVVAHSMGNLVVAEMIANDLGLLDRLVSTQTKTKLIHSIISLAPPFKGSIKAYLSAQGWQHSDRFVPFLQADQIQDMGKNWPAIYQLLPQWSFLDQYSKADPNNRSIFAGTYDASRFRKLPGQPWPAILDEAEKVWSDLAALPLSNRWFSIIGDGEYTAATIEEYPKKSKSCFKVKEAFGDGTVPLLSASAGPVSSGNSYFTRAEHTALPKQPAVVDGVLQLLATRTIDGLSDIRTTPLQPSELHYKYDYIACSPIALSVSDSTNLVVDGARNSIPGGAYYQIGEYTQVRVPATGPYRVDLQGTGTGTFDLVVERASPDGSSRQVGFFSGVPVRTVSKGSFVVDASGSISGLSYDYMGKGATEVVPANVVPPTIQCTGCYLLLNNLRASLSFNVGFQGTLSTFAYNYRDLTKTVQFASTTIGQLSASGATSTFAGLGTLNGQPGYAFTAMVKDGGAPGSGLDSVTITILGPSGYSYSVTGAIAGGDVVVLP